MDFNETLHEHKRQCITVCNVTFFITDTVELSSPLYVRLLLIVQMKVRSRVLSIVLENNIILLHVFKLKIVEMWNCHIKNCLKSKKECLKQRIH